MCSYGHDYCEYSLNCLIVAGGRNNEDKKMVARKTYILIKDTPEFYKGAIFQEACDNGDQDFVCLTKNFAKPGLAEFTSLEDEIYGRKIVMKQPDFFMPYTEWVEKLPKGLDEMTATEVLKQHAKEVKKEKVKVKAK